MKIKWLSLPFIVMVIILMIMKRPWWCGCGNYWLWTTGNEHYSQHLFDPWVFSHFFHGGFFYGAFRGFMTKWLWKVALMATLILESIWEVVENSSIVIELYRFSGDRWYLGDTIFNSLGDLSACLLGALVLAGLLKR